VLVNVPVFSPHSAAGSTTSASPAVSVRYASETTRNRPGLPRVSRTLCSSGSDTAGLVPITHRNRIVPSSQCRKISIAWLCRCHFGNFIGSTFHSFAHRRTCSGFCQLRKNGNSPSHPVSRVFWAVGWPFICMTPHPGRPIRPSTRLTLFT